MQSMDSTIDHIGHANIQVSDALLNETIAVGLYLAIGFIL